MQRGETLDVHLVDHGVVPRRVRRAVALPTSRVRLALFHSRPWPNSVPMNSSFLPGWVNMVGIQRAQVGVLLPLVAGHLVQHRLLAVHHFVVRERQHEVLGEGIQHAEGQLAVVILAVHRVVRM
jgi:hypothetical protein